MTALQYTHKAVCSVCFCEHFLNSAKGRTEHPIRHGFHAYHVQHGQTGGFHTAPCGGVSFPHFGISTEGTKWALDGVLRDLASVNAHIANLNTKPELNWSYQATKRVSRYGTKERREPIGERFTRTLTLGMESERIEYKDEHGFTQHLHAPSYEKEWNSRMADAKRTVDQLERNRDVFQTAIKTWKPVAAKLAGPKVEMIHAAREVKVSYNDPSKGTYVAPQCKRIRQWDAGKYKTTTNPAEVTCKRCSGTR